jgi:hypothetical protein
MTSLPLSLLITQAPYAEANLTISTGVKFSSGIPPIVPLKPDIDLINVIDF